MDERENIMLSDEKVIPTEDLIFSYIGEKKVLWQTIMSFASDNFKDVSGSWKYYNDGKRWLYKFVQKKKTIFWACILEDTFRVTFYFGDKTEPFLDNSDLPEEIKSNFKTSKRYGSIRAISIKMANLSDVDTVKKLISIKTKLK